MKAFLIARFLVRRRLGIDTFGIRMGLDSLLELSEDVRLRLAVSAMISSRLTLSCGEVMTEAVSMTSVNFDIGMSRVNRKEFGYG